MVQLLKLKDNRISSRDISEMTGKPHNDVLKSIRAMEPAWEKIRGEKFPSQKYKNTGKEYPEFLLSKTECLYIATKFNDEARAILVTRWEHLEIQIKSRQSAKLECRPMTDAILQLRNDEGKETKPYHYSNEMNLINRIVLGVSSKKWKESHEIHKDKPIRDTLTPMQIQAIEKLQNMNTNLIELSYSYDDRKSQLNEYYEKRWASKILDEFIRLEA